MSVRALLLGVEGRLRSVLSDPDGKIVGVQPDGRPPPGFGQWYYAIHFAGKSGATDYTTADQLDAYYAVLVTITRRAGEIPTDRRGRFAIEDEMIDRAEVISVPGVIHGSYEVLDAANALIDGFNAETNGFIEPLWFADTGPVKQVGPDWVRAKEGKDVFTIPVRFGRARRIQVR